MAGWNQRDYNITAMRAFSDSKINRELERLRGVAARRLEVFERKYLERGREPPGFVDYLLEIVESVGDVDTVVRRGRIMAVMELHRFLASERSSYSKYIEILRKTQRMWRGYGVKVTMSQMDDFLDFLGWVRSLQGGKYELNAVKNAWVPSGGDVERAKEIYEEMYL